MATVGVGGNDDGQTVDLGHLLTHDVVVANASNNLVGVRDEFLNTLSFPRDEVISMLSLLVDEGFVEHLDDDTYRTVK